MPTDRASPVITPGASVPSARARSPARISSRPVPSTTARDSNAVRAVASAYAVSNGRSSGRAVAWSSSRAAWARSASGVAADSVQGRTAGAGRPVAEPVPAAGRASSAVRVGLCSSTTCALVPLRPKAETPARRGRPVAGQGRSSVTSSA